MPWMYFLATRRKLIYSDLYTGYHHQGIPCADIAQSMNAPLSANMVMLGYYVANSAWLKADNIEEVIRETFAKKPKVAEINVEAFRKGIAYFNEDNH